MRILIVGCGDVGLRAARLLAGHARLYGLIRSPRRRDELLAAGITPLIGDLDDRASLKRLAGLADAVLHFAPPPAQGESDPRTRRLLAALRANPRASPRRGRSLAQLIYISTSGVYGDCAGEAVPETRPARPGNPRARRRADAEAQLRRWGCQMGSPRKTRFARFSPQGAKKHSGRPFVFLESQRGTRVSILRAPGIYARERMPEERVRKGLPAIVSADDVYTNHIHADDLARLAVAALFRGRGNRLYNAVDDSGLKMGDWFDLVADHLGLPRPPRLPREQVLAAVTPAMRSFLAESRRLSNQRIKRELRFRLRYPTVREGLRG